MTYQVSSHKEFTTSTNKFLIEYCLSFVISQNCQLTQWIFLSFLNLSHERLMLLHNEPIFRDQFRGSILQHQREDRFWSHDHLYPTNILSSLHSQNGPPTFNHFTIWPSAWMAVGTAHLVEPDLHQRVSNLLTLNLRWGGGGLRPTWISMISLTAKQTIISEVNFVAYYLIIQLQLFYYNPNSMTTLRATDKGPKIFIT